MCRGSFKSVYLWHDVSPISLKEIDSVEEIDRAMHWLQGRLTYHKKHKHPTNFCSLSFQEYFQMNTFEKRVFEAGLEWENSMKKLHSHTCHNCSRATIKKMKRKKFQEHDMEKLFMDVFVRRVWSIHQNSLWTIL